MYERFKFWSLCYDTPPSETSQFQEVLVYIAARIESTREMRTLARDRPALISTADDLHAPRWVPERLDPGVQQVLSLGRYLACRFYEWYVRFTRTAWI